MVTCAFIPAITRERGGGRDVIGSVLGIMAGVGVFVRFIVYARVAPGQHRLGVQHIGKRVLVVVASTLLVWGRGVPDGPSGLDDEDRLRVALVFVGYLVLRMSSSVSSLIVKGYWAVSSSSGESRMSHILPGSWIPGV